MAEGWEDFAVGQRVEYRDGIDDWRTGTITKTNPLLVRQDHFGGSGYRWDEVRPIAGEEETNEASASQRRQTEYVDNKVENMYSESAWKAPTSVLKVKKMTSYDVSGFNSGEIDLANGRSSHMQAF